MAMSKYEMSAMEYLQRYGRDGKKLERKRRVWRIVWVIVNLSLRTCEDCSVNLPFLRGKLGYDGNYSRLIGIEMDLLSIGWAIFTIFVALRMNEGIWKKKETNDGEE
jgi:hypothetical protein